MGRVDVAIVGAGQAGLAASYELALHGVEHQVLERRRVGQTWRDRWDSFCLVTPNWTVQLPGGAYGGDDPDGFMPKAELVAHLEAYATSFHAPVREGVEVESIAQSADRVFRLRTSMGELRATRVILATGAYQRPYRPTVAPGFGRDLLVIDVAEYRNPGGLPPGDVLVVGSGQSGCQIAEELHESGRRVVLSCGRTPWAPRRIAGRDVIWWAIESGFLDVPVSSLPDPAARLVSTILTTGHGGGHDLHLRTLRALGVELVGHLRGADGGAAYFDRDLGESAAWGDERCRELIAQFAKMASERGLGRIDPVELSPFDPTSPSRLSLRGFGTVIFAGGFRPAYRDWLPWPDAFDALGFPIVSDGASTVIDGLYFVGTHFLRKRKSGLLFGVGEDAAIVAATVAHGVESSASSVR